MKNNVFTKTKKVPMEGKVRKGFKAYMAVIICLTMLVVQASKHVALTVIPLSLNVEGLFIGEDSRKGERLDVLSQER